MDNLLTQFNQIKCFVFDIDGVLTDGNIYVGDDGTFARSMNTKDGYALQLAVKKGYQVWIISGAKNIGAKIRLEKLGIKEVHIAIKDKLACLKVLENTYSLNSSQLLYMGDDMPDIEPMTYCGMATCPKDACNDVLSIAQYVSTKYGGEGCVRDVIEKVLKLHNNWE